MSPLMRQFSILYILLVFDINSSYILLTNDFISMVKTLRYFDVWPKFRFLTEILIFNQNVDFRRKVRFLTQNWTDKFGVLTAVVKK